MFRSGQIWTTFIIKRHTCQQPCSITYSLTSELRFSTFKFSGEGYRTRVQRWPFFHICELDASGPLSILTDNDNNMLILTPFQITCTVWSRKVWRGEIRLRALAVPRSDCTGCTKNCRWGLKLGLEVACEGLFTEFHTMVYWREYRLHIYSTKQLILQGV